MTINYSQDRAILLYLVYFAVFVDAIFGALTLANYGSIKLSLVYRLVILVTFVVLIFRSNNFFSNYIKFILVLWVTSLFNLVITGRITEIFLDIQIFVKVLFPFAVFFILYQQLKHKNYCYMVCKGLSLFGFVAGILFLFSILTGIGFQNYSADLFGISSFFFAGNDIGIALVLSLCFSWLLFLTTPGKYYFFAILFTSLALVLLGTRTGILGATIVDSIYIVIFLFRKYPNLHFQKSMLFPKLIISVFLSVTVFFIISFVLENLDMFSIQLERFGDVAEGHNPRAILIEQGMKYINQRPLIEGVLGSGTYYQLELAKGLMSTVQGTLDFHTYRASFEHDIYDIHALYGKGLGGAILLAHLFFLLFSIVLFIKNRCLLSLTLCISLGLVFIIGNLSGHGITSAQVGTLFGFYLFSKLHV
ncbi:O-antigen ligase family protein [Colwellia sp. MSW7]|uniref:O-antigen ligase family protein n=1 Tax=Colwellia maritima TaxID=2912588 RepID=A0ABS9X4A6_9GAMM|nr:O-antigen ligase family protein [Colwellia maritima]MCI2285067.1 O-antigen ligase family protein [Colwellia maritima]